MAELTIILLRLYYGQWSVGKKVNGRYKKMKNQVYIGRRYNYKDWVDAIDDVCSDCVRYDSCFYRSVCQSWQCWRYSRVKTFTCDRKKCEKNDTGIQELKF